MKNILIKFLFILVLVLPEMVMAQMVKNFTGPPTIESKHNINSRIDSTGGLQVPGGIYGAPNIDGTGIPGASMIIPINKAALDPYRGPDLLNPCAYFASTLIANDHCLCQELLEQIYPGSTNSQQPGPCNDNAGGSTGTIVGGTGQCTSAGDCNGTDCIDGNCSCTTSADCPSGSHCNQIEGLCLATGSTCQGGCLPSGTFPSSSPYNPADYVGQLVVGTWFQYSVDGGYQYEKCNYVYNSGTGWEMIAETVVVNELPPDAEGGACSYSTTPTTVYTPEDEDEEGDEDDTGGEDEEEEIEESECMPGSGVGYYPDYQTCTTHNTQTCAGNCPYSEQAPYNGPGSIAPKDVYVINTPIGFPDPYSGESIPAGSKYVYANCWPTPGPSIVDNHPGGPPAGQWPDCIPSVNPGGTNAYGCYPYGGAAPYPICPE